MMRESPLGDEPAGERLATRSVDLAFAFEKQSWLFVFTLAGDACGNSSRIVRFTQLAGPPVHECSRERQRSIRWVANRPPPCAVVRAETGMAAGLRKA
jgi:hypothetical protein